MKILVLNSGSSSLKYQVIDMETKESLVEGYYERIGQPTAFLTHKRGEKFKFEVPVQNHEEAIKVVMEKLTSEECGVISNLNDLAGIGHRVVHGGEKFTSSVVITDEVIEEIRRCAELAPLHNPAAVLGIEACKKIAPEMSMVAVFDTAFHQTLKKEQFIYPIPHKYYEKYGVRKYGFHGTSHSYVSKRVAEFINEDISKLKIINCHLGQGCSVCAIDGGVSVETSMGLTPLAGLAMGSRSGDLDPSVVTYLMKKENLTVAEVENILNKESGLFGMSEISVDMRDIEDADAKGDEKARLSLDVFHYIVASHVAKCAVAMGGVDIITFTAGVGENGKASRKDICERLKFLGIDFDEEKNDVRGKEREITTENSKVRAFIIPTNEELMIAQETSNLI